MTTFLLGCVASAVSAATISGNLMALAANSSTPLTVRAPFQVVGASDKVLLEVTEKNGLAQLTLRGGNNTELTLRQTASGMAIDVANDDRTTFASLSVDNGTALMKVGTTAGAHTLKVSADEQSYAITKGSTTVINLGTQPSKNAALRIYAPTGTPAAAMGSSAHNNGAGSINIEDAAGHVTGNWVVAASGSSTLAISANNTPVAVLSPSKGDAGGKIELNRADGVLGFQAGASAAGGLACAYVEGKGPRCINPSAPQLP